jgi:hypothetical protein
MFSHLQHPQILSGLHAREGSFFVPLEGRFARGREIVSRAPDRKSPHHPKATTKHSAQEKA